MNNERYNQIIDEVYENYKTKTEIMMGHGFHGTLMSHEKFINKCITNTEFSERWGLKIEERDLSLEERYNIWFNNNYETGMERFFDPNELPDFDNSYYEPTPIKVVTVTYKDEKIEVYE